VGLVELHLNGSRYLASRALPLARRGSTRHLQSCAYRLQALAYDAAGNWGTLRL
jgi:hypothetical protein